MVHFLRIDFSKPDPFLGIDICELVPRKCSFCETVL